MAIDPLSAKRAALENMKKVLAAAGCEMKHIVKANIYLTDIARDFGPMNEVYKEVSSSRRRSYIFIRL